MPVIKAGTRTDASIKGADYGASISLILDESDPVPRPPLHRHPYDETWVVQEGYLTFQCGEDRLALGAGDIVIVPSGMAHKFTNDGAGRSKLVCIHASPTFIGEWLEWLSAPFADQQLAAHRSSHRRYGRPRTRVT